MEYALTLKAYREGELRVEGELTSPLLEPTLHPGGSVDVWILAPTLAVKPKPRFALDGFHVESLHEFLRLQGTLRDVVAQEVERDRATWASKRAAAKPAEGPLAGAEVVVLHLRPRKVPSEQTLERFRQLMGAEEFAAFAAAEDTPATRSYFQLSLRCPWDREHELAVRFRDGAFAGVAKE